MFPNYSISTSRTSSPKMTMSIAEDRTSKSKWLRDTGRPSALSESSAQVRWPQTLIALHCSKALGSQKTPKRLPACPHTVCSRFPGFPITRGAMRGPGMGGGSRKEQCTGWRSHGPPVCFLPEGTQSLGQEAAWNRFRAWKGECDRRQLVSTQGSLAEVGGSQTQPGLY